MDWWTYCFQGNALWGSPIRWRLVPDLPGNGQHGVYGHSWLTLSAAPQGACFEPGS